MADKKEDPIELFQERMEDEGYKIVSPAELKKKQAQVAKEQKEAVSKGK